jgi:hypothetical protein
MSARDFGTASRPRARWKTWTLRALAALVALYLGAFCLLALFQRAAIYPRGGANLTPQQAGLPQGERIELTTADGERLAAWSVAPAADPSRVVFLYFHGNGGTLALRAERFRGMTARGDGLLAVEYRGYPGSTGSPSEQGLLRDADALLAEATRRGYPHHRIVLVGESLGTGVAVALAASTPKPFAGVVLDSAYDSVVHLASTMLPIFPVPLALQDAWRSDLRVNAIRAPLLMIHGAADAGIPIGFGQRLFALAPEPKRFIAVPGRGHLALEPAMQEMLNWVELLRTR